MEALLLGRKTYEIFAAYWPQAAAEDPIAARLNSVPSTSPRARSALWSGVDHLPKGAVLLGYQRTGKPTYGSMA